MFLCKAVCWVLVTIACSANEYVIDNSVGHGRRFDGVGAISGGGVRCSCSVQLSCFVTQKRSVLCKTQNRALVSFTIVPVYGQSVISVGVWQLLSRSRSVYRSLVDVVLCHSRRKLSVEASAISRNSPRAGLLL